MRLFELPCEEGFHYLLEEGVLIELLKFFQITLLPFYLMLLASCRRSWFQVSKNFTSKWYNSRGCYLYSSQDKTYPLELCSKVAPVRAILTPNLAMSLSWETFALRDLNPGKDVHTGHLSFVNLSAETHQFMSLTLKKGSQFGDQQSKKWDWFYVIILNVWFWFDLVLFSQLWSLTTITTFPHSPTPVYLASC